MKYKITEIMASLYAQNYYLPDGTLLKEKEYFKSIKAGMKEEVAAGAVHSLANFMRRGLMVELDGRFEITSNRESVFGRYDIMLIPKDREKDCAYIIEFKVYKPLKENDLAQTVANALNQIEEKRYEAKLAADGFAPENIRKYGFAFKGKECMIGC